MCTVTFIPVNKSVFITHNRDEKNLRSKAIPPEFYQVNGSRLLFPKDGEAGGSWVGMNEHGHAAVLLNGAYENHIPTPPYRKSRGLILLDLLSSGDLAGSFKTLHLDKIEPFTVVLWNGKNLTECRWDGSKKHSTELNPMVSHIWSSATLYDENIMQKRLSWFDQWKQKHPFPDLTEIVQFHLQGGDGDQSNDLRMNRDGMYSTLSVTAMEISNRAGRMRYIDLSDYTTDEKALIFKKRVVESQ